MSAGDSDGAASRRQGRASRRERVVADHAGSWASHSQDFLRLAEMLYRDSAAYAASVDGNCSPYTLAAIPLLVAGFRCLLIELAAGMYASTVPQREALTDLDQGKDLTVLQRFAELPGDLDKQLKLVYEVRHELAHPSPRPGPEGHSTPSYLAELRKLGVLQSRGSEPDYHWLSQLQSHRLFTWVWEVLEEAVLVVVDQQQLSRFARLGIAGGWARYRDVENA